MGPRPWLWLTGSTQGGHIRHQESLAEVCNSEARGKLCFAQHPATWIFIPALCKHQDIPAAGSTRAWLPRCPSAARADPGSLQAGGPGPAALEGPARFSYGPQWQQCLEMNTGITVPGRSACHLTNTFSPKPLTNPVRTLIIPILQDEDGAP